MNDLTKAMLVGDPVESPVAPPKPKTRAQRIVDWRAANEAAYRTACDARCECSPTRAQLLLLDQWERPPVD